MMNQGPMRMLSEFNNFARNYRGDPKREIENLLRSGQMSQDQLNQLQQFAHQFKALAGMK